MATWSSWGWSVASGDTWAQVLLLRVWKIQKLLMPLLFKFSRFNFSLFVSDYSLKDRMRERESPRVTFLSLIYHPLTNHWASQVALVVKNPPANAGDIRDTSLIPGVGNGNPLQYSCLENPMDRGAMGSWWAMVHGVTKSQTQLKQLSTAHNQLLTHL